MVWASLCVCARACESASVRRPRVRACVRACVGACVQVTYTVTHSTLTTLTTPTTNAINHTMNNHDNSNRQKSTTLVLNVCRTSAKAATRSTAPSRHVTLRVSRRTWRVCYRCMTPHLPGLVSRQTTPPPATRADSRDLPLSSTNQISTIKAMKA